MGTLRKVWSHKRDMPNGKNWSRSFWSEFLQIKTFCSLETYKLCVCWQRCPDFTTCLHLERPARLNYRFITSKQANHRFQSVWQAACPPRHQTLWVTPAPPVSSASGPTCSSRCVAVEVKGYKFTMTGPFKGEWLLISLRRVLGMFNKHTLVPADSKARLIRSPACFEQFFWTLCWWPIPLFSLGFDFGEAENTDVLITPQMRQAWKKKAVSGQETSSAWNHSSLSK